MELGIRGAQRGDGPTDTILAELNDLAGAGLLGTINSDGELVRVGETIGGLGGFQTYGRGVDLTTVRLTNMGGERSSVSWASPWCRTVTSMRF